MLEWYIIHCQPQKEPQTAELLESILGLTTYLPQVQQQYRGEIQAAPLFPRYLFVQVDLFRTHPTAIVSLPGVVRIVGIEQEPQAVPPDVVETLRQRVAAINQSGCLLDHGFRPGDTVRFKKGPMYGLEAIFQGNIRSHERVRVLMEFMGRLNRLDVDAKDLEQVAHKPHPPRRTRGKGRKIQSRERQQEEPTQW